MLVLCEFHALKQQRNEVVGRFSFAHPKGKLGLLCRKVCNVQLRSYAANPNIDGVELAQLPKDGHHGREEVARGISPSQGRNALIASHVKVDTGIPDEARVHPNES